MEQYLGDGKDNAEEWKAATLTTIVVFHHFNNDQRAVYFTAVKMRTLYKALKMNPDSNHVRACRFPRTHWMLRRAIRKNKSKPRMSWVRSKTRHVFVFVLCVLVPYVCCCFFNCRHAGSITSTSCRMTTGCRTSLHMASTSLSSTLQLRLTEILPAEIWGVIGTLSPIWSTPFRSCAWVAVATASVWGGTPVPVSASGYDFVWDSHFWLGSGWNMYCLKLFAKLMCVNQCQPRLVHYPKYCSIVSNAFVNLNVIKSASPLCAPRL